MDNPTICIPRVDNNIDKWIIDEAFKKLNIGIIEKIDISYNPITKSKRVFIHFIKWFNNETSNKLKNLINNDNKECNYFNVVYDFPLFWKCYKSYLPKKIMYK
jgi:hypothetical protein